ncbi:MAG: MFS transporter [Chloroflexi bacterium]|nr:MFS transporter [Chloroflexota bacterium]MYF22517.1 MFS transporter [Chloroflexota bacterium]
MSLRIGPREGGASGGLLQNTGFRRVWAAGAITGMVRWLDMLVLTLFARDLTEAAGFVALAFLIRMLPRLLFGMFVGAIADRFDRKKIWIGALLILSVMYFVLTAYVMLIGIDFWTLLVFIFIAGIVWSVEFPTRRAMIADVVAPHQVGRAVGLDWSTDSIVRIPGPLIGAGLLQELGAEWAYLFTACAFIASAAIASTLSYRKPLRSGGAEGFGEVARETWRDIRDGFSYIRRSELLLGTLMVTLAFNLLFPAYNAALPDIGQELLGVDKLRIGVLEALVGAGSFVSALAIAGWSSWGQSGRIYYAGTAWFLCCVTGMVLSPWYELSMLISFCMGFGFSAFAIMQTSLLVTRTPAEMRGRVMGVLSMVIGMGPVTGLQVFFMFEWFGIQGGVISVVIEAAVFMLLAILIWPVVIRRLAGSDPRTVATFAPQRVR